MPIYDYECKNCGRVFEDICLTTVSHAPPPICPSCYAMNVERKASATKNVKYYGGGTYKKDYRDTGDWA